MQHENGPPAAVGDLGRGDGGIGQQDMQKPSILTVAGKRWLYMYRG